MDRAAAEREAIRLWRNLPVQDRLTRSQASAFARMIAPTLDFGAPEQRAKLIEGWIARELPRTETAISFGGIDAGPAQARLAVPPWPQREGASAIALVISLLVMIARRPDIVANAMLWAEDGAVWFADAYNTGPAALLQSHGGYLQSFSRLVFGLLTLLPLSWVPAASVWIGLLIRAALPAFIFSSRFSWIDWRAKVAISAYFVLMPNLAEVHANITNTHWYLGLYLLAVVFADAPRSRGWKIHDWLALLLAGSSGPFIFFVLPALGLRAAAQRNTPSVRWPFLGVAALLALLQAVTLGIWAGTGSVVWPAPANPLIYLQALGSRVFLGFLSPARWSYALARSVISMPVVAAGVVILIAVLVRGSWRARGLAVIAPLVLAAAMFTPIFSLIREQWPPLLGADEPGFYVLTSMTWAGTLVYFAAIYLPRLSSFSLASLVAVCGFLILFDFTLPAVQGPSFAPEAEQIEAAAPGESITVPIAPPGWDMTLIKR